MRPLALKTILVATDPDDDAMLPALRSAVQLAQLAGARLHVVHATSQPHESNEKVIAQLERADIDPTVPADIIVHTGPPGAVIGQHARRLGADVVVLGPHRQRTREMTGGTADRVVFASATPCLILPVPLPLPLKTVLAPVDSSDGARGALATAMTWASALRPRGANTELLVLHVTSGVNGTGATTDDIALQAEVGLVRDQLSAPARVNIRTIIEPGDAAADTILHRAAQEYPDLLVIGTRRTSMSTAAMLGSVSSAVARNASCPVLLVPPEVWAQATAMG